MSFEIPEHFHSQFTRNVELLLQQRQPKLLGAVGMGSYSGESAQVVKQFGEVEFQEKNVRHKNTTFSDIEHKQRWVFPVDYTLALPVDKEDELRLLDSPLSPYAEAMRAAWARRVDQTISDAFFGAARTGKNGSESTAFDTANQQIAVGASGLTVSKLIEAREILRGNEVDLDAEPVHIALTSTQFSDLLEDEKVTSADYNTVRALTSGEINTYMGFVFHHYEGLGVDGSDNRRIPVWVPSGVHFAQWGGFNTRIDERPDKEYLTQVFMSGTVDATRTQEGKVIEILCDES